MHRPVAANTTAVAHPAQLPNMIKRMLRKLSSPASSKQIPHADIAVTAAVPAAEIPALRQTLAWQPDSLPHWLRLGLACAGAGRFIDAAQTCFDGLADRPRIIYPAGCRARRRRPR